MITTLAWVVLLTALTRPLRQVLRHESTRREPLKPDAVFEDKAEFAIGRVRQARSHRFENLGILASYARHAGQESGESRFPDPCHRNAGITSRANRLTECRASSAVMSPKASQGTK